MGEGFEVSPNMFRHQAPTKIYRHLEASPEGHLYLSGTDFLGLK